MYSLNTYQSSIFSLYFSQ